MAAVTEPKDGFGSTLSAKTDRQIERPPEQDHRTQPVRAIPDDAPGAVGGGVDHDRVVVAAVLPPADLHDRRVTRGNFEQNPLCLRRVEMRLQPRFGGLRPDRAADQFGIELAIKAALRSGRQARVPLAVLGQRVSRIDHSRTSR
jgi:hypothetical protein